MILPNKKLQSPAPFCHSGCKRTQIVKSIAYKYQGNHAKRDAYTNAQMQGLKLSKEAAELYDMPRSPGMLI
jgi:hypothetical protein